jgi:hypothetical protein
MAVYVLLIRPYSSILSTILSVVNELLLVLMILGCVRFMDPIISPDESRLIGTLFVGIIIGTIAVNWVGIVIYGITIGVHKIYM